jgi:cell wall-associated NlpC family hydrolase
MAGNIIGAAYSIYGLGTGSKSGTPIANIKNPDAKYEYGQTGRLGVDTNNNGIREVDCSVLVYNAMRSAGYYLPDTNAAGFTTQTLFNANSLTQTAQDTCLRLRDGEPHLLSKRPYAPRVC